MRIPLFGSLLLLSIISLGLAACGTGKTSSAPASPVIPVPAQSPPTTLTGNWFLAGSRVPASYPVVSTSLYVQGNTVSGEASVSYQCGPAGTLGGGGSATLSIQGTIANDGTFQASTEPMLGGFSVSLSLAGNSPPAASPSSWTGTYSVTSTASASGVGCNTAQTAPFVATPIASVTGTYIGIPANDVSPFGDGSVISVQITQGTPTLVSRGSINYYQIPLTANLTITNTPCPFSASTTGLPELSSISGDHLELLLTPGVPYGYFIGTLNEPSSDTFSGDLTSVANANGCPGIALYNFTRK